MEQEILESLKSIETTLSIMSAGIWALATVMAFKR